MRGDFGVGGAVLVGRDVGKVTFLRSLWVEETVALDEVIDWPACAQELAHVRAVSCGVKANPVPARRKTARCNRNPDDCGVRAPAHDDGAYRLTLTADEVCLPRHDTRNLRERCAGNSR